MTVWTSSRARRARSLFLALFATGDSTRANNVVLVAVRAVLGWIFFYYGAGKLFGLFSGPGVHETAVFFSTTAHLHPGGFFAVVAGVIEFGGALALIFGFASRLAALALIGDQVIAIITVTGRNGINSLTATPGYEFNLTLVALALVVAILGAGSYSLDTFVTHHMRLNEKALSMP